MNFDKIDTSSKDLIQNNIEKIRELFPNVVKEAENGLTIDFETLKTELSGMTSEGKEKYEFTWVGKKGAEAEAYRRINKTLRPCKEESVDWENTENLYIEGDNLDVLKLLQESYLNKIKMIYIDPPYNTGNDSFIYPDDYKTNKDQYDEEVGAIDESGYRMFKNTETNGRFHSSWCSMMYPRLKLARNLLSEDGVIFISIDDNEVDNMKKICDEVFGGSNFVGNIIWRKKTGASDAKGFAVITEYILVYIKNAYNITSSFAQDTTAFDTSRYKLTDEYEERRGKHYIDNLDRGSLQYSDSLNYGITCPDGTTIFPNDRLEYKNDGWIWTWSKQKVEWGLKNGFIVFRKNSQKKTGWTVCRKNYLYVDKDDNIVEKSNPYKNTILDIINTTATKELQALFDGKYFDYPKPSELIKLLQKYIKFDKKNIILDFFSGSATTAHAVMQLNAEDGGNRKFIMVQLPEVCDEKSEAYKAGYTNICEIGKERIRRAGKKIKEETGKTDLDIGFRVLKASESNFNETSKTPAQYTQADLLSMVDNIKQNTTDEELLFSCLLNLGLELSLPYKVETIDGKKVHIVDNGIVVACFDNNISRNVIFAMADLKPEYVIFRDSSFKTDAERENVTQIFKQRCPYMNDSKNSNEKIKKYIKVI